MPCKMRIDNMTPLQMWRLPSNMYPVRAALRPDLAARRCRFKDEQMIAVIDGSPHHMARVYPSSDTWTYTQEAYSAFRLQFTARYRHRVFGRAT
jgi:hypothetical protein